MPGINERMAVQETKLDSVIYTLDEVKQNTKDIKNIWENHIEKCHQHVSGCAKRLNEMEIENKNNIAFRKNVRTFLIWLIPGGPTSILIIIFGLKELIKRGFL